ncbi:MAG: 3TM-type holin [Candidatus Heimdallarchaeaceae archaeon]
MRLFKKLFAKKAGTGVSNVLDSVGNLATDIRSAITGDMPPEVKANLYSKILDITLEVTKTQANVIRTEIQGNWLQRSWRPMLAMVCVLIIAWNYLLVPIIGHGLRSAIMPKQLWTLLTISLSGYVAGRSAEKVISNMGGK